MNYKYGKTFQFKDVIRDFTHLFRYRGQDEETGEPIYSSDPLPKLMFRGTVKLHGTNAGIMENTDGSIQYLSRNNVVGLGKHFGFPEAMEGQKDEVRELFNQINSLHNIGQDQTVIVYGEWCGPSVQKGVAISKIENKTFFFFSIKVINKDGTHFWVPIDAIGSTSDTIRSILDFQHFYIDIDMNNPGLHQNKLIELTQAVEDKCPVAAQYGIEGVGEGVVYETFYKDKRFIFKVKGAKHSSSKVKTLASVDPEKAKSQADFIEYAVTLNRVKQAMFEVAQQKEINESDLNKSHTGDVLRWIANDILSEELDTMQASKLEWKEVAKQASNKARLIFFDIVDKV